MPAFALRYFYLSGTKIAETPWNRTFSSKKNAWRVGVIEGLGRILSVPFVIANKPVY